MKKIAEFTIRFRWVIILFFVALTIIMGAQMKNSTFNADMMTYMPDDMPSRIHRQKIEDLFGGTEMIMIIIQDNDIINAQTLKRVKKLSRGMTRIKGVDKVMSLFETKQVRSEDGAMLVDPAVRMFPKNQADADKIKAELQANDLVLGSVVSEDFTTTAIIALLDPGLSDKYIVEAVEKLVETVPGEEAVSIGGTPFTRVHISTNMMQDIVKLLPLGLLLMLIFLFICFRQFRGVWLPFLIVIMAICVSMGIMPLLGWDITAISIILPVLLIAVANDYGIHMIAKYQEDNTPESSHSKRTLALNMVAGLGKPILLAGATTIVGLFCLLGHILIPAGQIGILAAIGIAVALLASLLFIPAVSAILPKTRPIHKKQRATGRKTILEKILGSFGNMVSTQPKKIVIGSALFSLVCVAGLFKIVVDTNPIKYFSDGHPVVNSTNILNTELGGYFPLSIVFEGDIKDPGLLKRIDEVEKQINQLPEVGATSSIARVVRQISRAINDEGEDLYDRIPDTYNAVSQYFELYMMSGEPDDLEKMVDFNFENAMILIRFTNTSTPVLRKSIRQIKQIVGDDVHLKYIGGTSAVFSELDLCVVNGQLTSLTMAVAVVFLLIWIMFKSFRGALLSIIPLVLSMVILFGIMGFAAIDLNMVTALLSSIMIGVGIDYTIHYIWRYKTERQKGLNPTEATKKTLQTTGRGIIFNALSVIIGFAALLFSAFMPVKFFGVLVVITIAACLLGALLIVPALCIWIRPKFLEPDVTSYIETEPIQLPEEIEITEATKEQEETLINH
ncbi:RND family transporter [Marinilabiliaceae bacterium JC017]|nr:RND family transporter [Marinilabiliaceae bacterium JC017]